MFFHGKLRELRRCWFVGKVFSLVEEVVLTEFPDGGIRNGRIWQKPKIDMARIDDFRVFVVSYRYKKRSFSEIINCVICL